MSGLFFLGVGQRSATSYGGDLRLFGATQSGRLRPDGTIVPRNNFTQPTRRRTDLRFQQRIPLPGRRSLEGIAEVFNIFNSPNWTISTQESRSTRACAIITENRASAPVRPVMA